MSRSRFSSEGDDGDAPTIGAAANPWAAPLGVAASVLIGCAVFWQLTANRARIEHARMTDPAPNAEPIVGDDIPPPPDFTTFETPPPQVDEIPIMAEVLDAAVEPTPDQEARLRSPTLVVDLSEASAPQPAAGAIFSPARVAGAVMPAPGADTLNGDERFAERLGVREGGDRAVALRLANPSRTVVQGAIIPGVLETAINSDLPGFVRGTVTSDVRSFDGTEVLIPRGSRIVGQYRSGVALGQSRAFVIWTRLIRPDGVSIDLASPGADALGRGGLDGRVDRHFLQRFGGAILLSLISAGAAAVTESADTQVVIASARANDAASFALQGDVAISPTIEVPQGTRIRIFVSADLDFSVLDQEP